MSPEGHQATGNELIDAQGVADLLGLAHRNSVSGYQRRYDDMPRPEIDPGPGRPKLWRRVAIEAWAVREGRILGDRGPSRDPFYNTILVGLAGSLDPLLFEACAADVLRPEIAVVPVSGGDDLGMDGAVFDGDGPAYPLVTTTAKDAIGNLTRNLTRYMETGGERRLAVFATSRDLSPRRRRNLELRAESLGFTLVQVIDRRGFANRLYRNPRWCKELLGASGEPSPLSQVPLTSRPIASTRLVGRESESRLLSSGTGDQLLVGPPGSGKTALLVQLVQGGKALFLASADRSSIANGVRAQQPETIIVDDAHVRLEDLVSLVQLRTELGASFRIVASSWTSDAHMVAGRLGLPGSAVLEVGRLTRDQIVEVVGEAGIAGPSTLVREIVDQAEGLPGLAVTLAGMCLRAGVRDVVLGNAISRDVRATLEPRLGPRAIQVLATVGIGGDRGMSLADAAEALDLPLVDVQWAAVGLSEAGVLHEGRDAKLVVRPRALRHALVRDVFFGQAPSLPVAPLLAYAIPHEAAITLVEAAGIGGHVPTDLLLGALEAAGSDLAWALWARTGRAEARLVLKQRPSAALHHPHPFLHWLPAEALAVLLEAAVNDARELGPNPDHPLRLVADWLNEAGPDVPEALSRRQELTGAAIRFGKENQTSDLPGRVLSLVLHPGFESHSTDPGMGLTATLSFGLLPRPALEGIASLWSQRLLPFLKTQGVASLRPVVDVVTDWLHPSMVARADPPRDVAEMMTAFAQRVLIDVQPLTAGHPGLQLKVRDLTESAGLTFDALDPEYAALYGNLDLSDWEGAQAQRLTEVEAIATSHADDDPGAVVQKLAGFEREALEAGHTWPRFSPQFMEILARECGDPAGWVREILSAELQADLLYPFLLRGLAVAPDATWQTASSLVDHALYQWTVAYIAFTRADAPARLVEAAVERSEGFTRNLLWVARGEEITHRGLVALLGHPDDAVASSVAIGLWMKAEAPPSRSDLSSLWRQAVVRSPDKGGEGGYWLGRVLASDRSLAFEWLSRRLGMSPAPSLIGPSPAEDALNALDEESRRLLLPHLEPSFMSSFVARRLVGDSRDVYAELLGNDVLKPLHLTPLWKRPDERWLALAKQALNSGYSSDQLAEAAYSGMHSWSGDESKMWASWILAFEELSVGEDAGLQAVRDRGIELAIARRDAARARERERLIFGFD